MRVKKFAPLTLLEVQWEDTLSNPCWQTVEEIQKAGTATVFTVGFWRSNGYTKDRGWCIKVSSSMIEDGQGDTTCIPWACVRKIFHLQRTVE